MKTDKELLASERQPIAGSTVSTDAIIMHGLLGASRGRGLRAMVEVDVPLTGGNATGITVDLIQADDAALTVNVAVVGSTGLVPNAAQGRRLMDTPVPDLGQPYAGFRYTVAGGTYAAGAITAGFVAQTDTPFGERPPAASHGY